mmetsp:Transcript_11552/g.17769  ORF Transcript_11552/g.17769 Transcript_11552/m.17769 type:complete len:81 (+) Transcript_11552:353-595(+)
MFFAVMKPKKVFVSRTTNCSIKAFCGQTKHAKEALLESLMKTLKGNYHGRQLHQHGPFHEKHSSTFLLFCLWCFGRGMSL